MEEIVKKTVDRKIALPCLLKVDFDSAKHRAVLEFKMSEVCTACLAMNGLLFKYSLRIVLLTEIEERKLN